MYGCSKDCLILIPFRLPQISCFTLGLKCSSSDSDSCPAAGIRPLLQFRHPPRADPVLLTLLFLPQFLPPTEFCVGLYFLSTGQVLPSALSWCSPCTSVSEGVFLMYPWRDYSTSTSSSAILFSPHFFFFFKCPCMFSKELRALNADPGSYLTRLVFGMCCLSLTTVMDTFILLKKKKNGRSLSCFLTWLLSSLKECKYEKTL